MSWKSNSRVPFWIALKEKEIGELKNHLELLQVALTEHQEELKKKSSENTQQEQELDRLIRKVDKDRYLRYDDLRPDGLLGKNVKDFTFFYDFDCNDAFLDSINYADGSEGSLPQADGMCEILFETLL